MSFSYEIEIKVLLTTLENVETLKSKLTSYFPDIQRTSMNSQLNHYFMWGNFQALQENFSHLLPAEKFQTLQGILTHQGKFSFRTRFVDGNSILVVKLSLGADTSSNGVSRLEWEYSFVWMPIEGLDTLLLKSGFEYQAKWSREREEYALPNGITVCIDKNAWYGYLAEFEKVIDDKEKVEITKKEILDFIESLWLQELSQERLEKMFAYYNENWKEYYGTDKYFIIE